MSDGKKESLSCNSSSIDDPQSLRRHLLARLVLIDPREQTQTRHMLPMPLFFFKFFFLPPARLLAGEMDRGITAA